MKNLAKADKKQTLNLKIRGDLRHLTYKLHALIKAYMLGLQTTKMIKHQPGHLELEFVGEKVQLWKIVKWSKKSRIFSTVDEVMFTFTSVVKNK